MFEEKEEGGGNGNSLMRRWPLRHYLLSGVAALAMIAAVPALYRADTDAPVLQKNEAPGTLTLNEKAIGLPDFTKLVQRVKPATVSIRVKETGSTQLTSGDGPDNPFKGTPFEKFFKSPEGFQWKQVRPHRVEAQGSGFFISADGYIVTNNHVVDGACEAEIVTDDEQTLKAKVVGTDERSDLALLKAASDKKFPFVTLSKEKPEVGQWVLAVGNPFGLGGTVTAGIISAENRDIGEGPYDSFLQIDAPINRGNSGGPAFNLKGEVIGVNTAIYSPSGASAGIAFAIPAATVETVIPQLERKGYVRRGWLGVQVQPVTPDIAESLGMKNAAGALVSEPQPGSPAAEAGLKSGDVIAAVDGESVKDARDLARKIADIAPGTEVSLSVLRNGKAGPLKLKTGEMQEAKKRQPAAAEQNSQPDAEKLGLELAPASEVEGEGGNGVAIVAVDPAGEAAGLGIAPGDVILKAGGKAVSTPSEFKQALEAAKSAGRAHALVLLRHRNNEIYIAVPVSAG